MIKPINSVRGAVMVWLISYIFFLLTLANNFSASHDSINYMIGIVRGQHMFHPHHLLYHYYAHLWLLLFGKIYPALPEHYIIESFTALWGSGILAISYLFFRNRFGLNATNAAMGVTLIAFSYGTWFYSVNIEVYSPPIFFILYTLYIITRPEFLISDVWKVSILHSFAILFHQVNILFAVVVIYWLFVNRGKVNALASFFRYATLGLMITGIVYLMCGVLYEQKHTVPEFTNWILGYTKGHSYWQALSMKTPLNVLAGFSRAFIGGHFIFQLPVLENVLKESFRAHGLRDEIFLASNISPLLTWFLTVFTLLFISIMVVLVIRFVKNYKLMELHYQVINPLLLCIFVYSLFFCFWMPEILEFWILQMVLVWLILIGMLPAFRFPFNTQPIKGLFVLSTCLFLINFFGSIRWLQKSDSDWYNVEMRKLDPTLTSSDVVVVENEWILKDYVRYFSKAKVIATDEPDFNKQEAEKIVSDAVSQNHKVYVYRNGWQSIRSY